MGILHQSLETKIGDKNRDAIPAAGDLGPAGPCARGLPQKISTRQDRLLAEVILVNAVGGRLVSNLLKVLLTP